MKREARPALLVEGQQALGLYAETLRQMEDLSAVTVRNDLSDLRQFMAWCECCWREEWTAASFTPQAITPPLLIRYHTCLQTTLWLKPSSINRALMSLKRYFAWATMMQVIQQDPTSTIKFLPKEATTPRHLDDDEEGALIAAVNATGSLRDRTMITLLLHTELRARELCTLTCQQVHIGKRNGTLRIIGKRHKVRDVPLNATARTVLSAYLEMLPKESTYLFPSEKTREALTERALGHLVAKYAKLARLVDVSPHDLRHRFDYRMAEVVPLHRLAHIMGHNSLDTTILYIRGTKQDLQHDVEKIAWT
jgi:integrase/recombinase XerD